MLCDWTPDGCGRPATRVILSGCLESHVQERYYCEEHADDFVKLMRLGMVTCPLCRHARQVEYLVRP